MTAVLAVVLAAPPATAQSLRPASLERAVHGAGSSVVRFGQFEARAGDRVEQAISLETRMTTSVRDGSELVEKSRGSVRNVQRRVVTTTTTAAGRANAVHVRFLEATKQISVSDSTRPPDEERVAEAALPTAQPIQGKSYRCRREPGEDGRLIITDEQGAVPPLEEYQLVAESMETVGRANPLSEFLAGRTVAIGETLELPQEIADRLLGLGDRFGEVTQFDLTLEKTQVENGVPCAVFFAQVEAASHGSSQMRMQVEGPLVVEIESCRAVRVALSGPIGLSETRGSYSIAHQVLGTGRLQMSIATAYHDAKR